MNNNKQPVISDDDSTPDHTEAETEEWVNEMLEPTMAQLQEGMLSADAEMMNAPEEPYVMDLAQSSASQKSDEFNSMDEMLKFPDFDIDQNVPAQGPEAQAPEAPQLAAHDSVMPSMAQLQEGKSSADINFDLNNPAQASEAEVPSAGTSSAGPRHRYNLTELDGAPVKDKSDLRFSGVGLSNARMSMPGESRHSYSLPLDTRSGDGPVVTEGSGSGSLAFAQLRLVGMSPADAENAMMDENLAQLALSDPKSVKRKWSNRLSAKKSKKRKADHMTELETQEKTLQTQRDTLVAQQALYKKDTDRLACENNELRSNVQLIEQQNRMLDLMTDPLRMAVNRLRIETGQVVPNSTPAGMMMPFGVPHNFAQNPQQQAAQAHARMQQQQPSQAQMRMQLRPQVRMPPQVMTDPLRMAVNHLRIETGQVVPNSTPAGMMMHFGVPHNFALNPQQQVAQAHARMQQQQLGQAQMRMQLRPQVRMPPQGQGLVLPSWPNVASGSGDEAATGEGADATGRLGSDAERGHEAPGQGP